MEKKTIAVTGISGYFGRILLPLLEADEEIGAILGFDCSPLEKSSSVSGSPTILPGKLVFHQIDIRDPRFEPLLDGCDTLVHLAFQVMRFPGTRNIDDVNIKAMRAVCEAAARQKIRKLIITSSVVAYGLHADNPPILTEESPLRPNPGLYYSMAKASNELFLDEFAKRHPEMVITRLRPCTVAGPRADPAMMASLSTEPTIMVKGHNPPIQLIHENDLALALLHAIQIDLPGVYNATSDDAHTLTELVELRGGRSVALPMFMARFLMTAAWRLGKSAFAPEWIDLSCYTLVASNARLKATGWKPRYTTQETFLELVRHGSQAFA